MIVGRSGAGKSTLVHAISGLVPLTSGRLDVNGQEVPDLGESRPPSAPDALDAVGVSAVQRLRWGLIPQAAPELTSFLRYRFEIYIRAFVDTIFGAVRRRIVAGRAVELSPETSEHAVDTGAL